MTGAAPASERRPAAGAPLFSVVITCFNKEATIARAIRSALDQGDEHHCTVEVIVVDDRSSDRSAAIAQSFGDPRVSVILMPENGGPLAASLAGMRAARGRYLAMLDGDDVFVRGVLASLVDAVLIDDETMIRLRRARFTGDPGTQDSKRPATASTTFRPGWLYVLSQSTGGTSIIVPREAFDAADRDWPAIRIQDHVLPGLLSLHVRRVRRTGSVGYLCDDTEAVSHVSKQGWRLMHDRLIAESAVIARARTLGLPGAAIAMLGLFLGFRMRRYARKAGQPMALPDAFGPKARDQALSALTSRLAALAEPPAG